MHKAPARLAMLRTSNVARFKLGADHSGVQIIGGRDVAAEQRSESSSSFNSKLYATMNLEATMVPSKFLNRSVQFDWPKECAIVVPR